MDYTLSNKLHSINTKIDLIILRNENILENERLSELMAERDKVRKLLDRDNFMIIKSNNGYAVDKMEFGCWTFQMSFPNKKEATNYISKLFSNTDQLTLNF